MYTTFSFPLQQLFSSCREFLALWNPRLTREAYVSVCGSKPPLPWMYLVRTMHSALTYESSLNFLYHPNLFNWKRMKDNFASKHFNEMHSRSLNLDESAITVDEENSEWLNCIEKGLIQIQSLSLYINKITPFFPFIFRNPFCFCLFFPKLFVPTETRKWRF